MLLWERFPELDAAMMEDSSADLSYVACESLLMYGWVHGMLADPDAHASELLRVFDFVEALAVDGDRSMQDLVAIGVCENLLGAGLPVEDVDVAETFMGPRTRELLHWVDAQGWVRPRYDERRPLRDQAEPQS